MRLTYSDAGPSMEAARQTYRFGDFEFDPTSGELHKDGLKVRLQEQPFQILTLLRKRPGEVVTREEVRQALWPGDTFVDFDVGLNSAIKRLRDALGDSADRPRFVETLPRRGYRFIAPLETPEAPAAFAAPARPAPPPRSRLRSWGGAAAVVATVTLVAGLIVTGTWPRLRGQLASAPIRSLAVLPFENLTGDPEQDYFVDGMTDAVITDLAQVRALRVISRTSVTQYKGAKKALPRIAEELGVDAVVEGTVSRSADRVRITAQLIQAATDRHLWAQSYERELRDVLGLQREVASSIAQAAYAITGRQHEALEILARLEKASQERYVSPQGFAIVHLGLGNKKQAMAWLEKAYDARAFEVLVFSGPLFDRLRGDPQFQDLLRRMRLPTADRALSRATHLY